MTHRFYDETHPVSLDAHNRHYEFKRAMAEQFAQARQDAQSGQTWRLKAHTCPKTGRPYTHQDR